MSPELEAMPSAAPQVGICVLNYHQPEATVRCVQSLLEREPASTRILWLENDADSSVVGQAGGLQEAPFPWVRLDPAVDPLPPPGVVGLILNRDNLGYAGGNNVGLRLLCRHQVPFSWVINNDTLLVEGSSQLLRTAAQAEPGIGIWGAAITTDIYKPYYGGVIQTRDYRTRRCDLIAELEEHPLAFVSGCSLFFRTALAEQVGFIPEDYFLYFEDPAYSLEVKRAGLGIGALDTVRLWHHESLSTRRQNRDLYVYYVARNRWMFIQRYFPEALAAQLRRRWYRIQSLLFRGHLRHIQVEWLAYEDFRQGRTGRTSRTFSGIMGP